MSAAIAHLRRIAPGKNASGTNQPRPGSSMSPRQGQVFRLLLDGRSEKEVACALDLSIHTVHVYVKQIYVQWDVCTRAELLAAVLRVAGSYLRLPLDDPGVLLRWWQL